MTPEPQIIHDIRGHDEFLADRRSEGHAAVELDHRERELLDAWDAQAEALAVLEGRLAEATEALRRIGFDNWATVRAIRECAREALRAEPATAPRQEQA